MLRVFRWLLRIATGLVLISLAIVMLLYWFFSRSIPDYDEPLSVAGIAAPVEIVRDNANVPHIFGSSDADVYFGLGLAHAQDRLWQMLLLRRQAQGRLSEYFGTSTLRTDDLMRRLDLYNIAVRSMEYQDDYTRAALEAYAAGVNAWLKEVNEGARGRGAPEFWLFEPVVAPWQPEDSLAIGKLMALTFTEHAEAEVLRARLAAILPAARLADILPDYPGQSVADLPDYSGLFDAPMTRLAARPDVPDDPFYPIRPGGLAGASNIFAAAPSRSAAQGSLLANDPHLGLSAPSLFYLARLELASGGVIGATIPGAPVVLLGRSDRLGWGLTYAYVDDFDLYYEKVNPDNPEEVMTPEGWKPIRSRQSIIRVKDSDPVTITLRWSENGPILPNVHFGLETIKRPGHVVSAAWTLLAENDTSLQSFLRIMRAANVDDAIEAGRDFVGTAQNLVVVDRDRIAMKVIGAIPRRAARHQTQGRLPAPGWMPENRWQGTLSYSANPEFRDPEGGIIVNTNNKTVDRAFPLHVSFEWGGSQRIQRVQRLMQTREVHTRESFMEAQLDTVSIAARTLLPLVARELWFTGEAAPEGTVERQRRRALDLLAEWNGEMNEHLPEPLIYAAWMRALNDRLIRDELGPLADEFPRPDPLFLERVYRDVEGASAWCDVIQSAPVETCSDMARLALDDALVWITERYGPALESLRWGDAHQTVHRHDVLGRQSWLAWLVNIRQSTSGGDHTLLRAQTVGSGPEPFLNVHGPVYRGVYDFADPDSSVFIISTGQSGHPLSRYYDDLGELWRRGEYIPMTLDPGLARAGAVGITRLTPAE